jgi:hypothetical protein
MSCLGAPYQHFVLTQSANLPAWINECIVGAQDIKSQDELVHDSFDEYPDAYGAPSQGMVH